jgi:hypothetical protein
MKKICLNTPNTHTHIQFSHHSLAMDDFIPIINDNFLITFCAATNSLPNDIQRIIYKKTLCPCPVPNAPKKVTPSPRLVRLMEGWKVRRKLY